MRRRQLSNNNTLWVSCFSLIQQIKFQKFFTKFIGLVSESFHRGKGVEIKLWHHQKQQMYHYMSYGFWTNDCHCFDWRTLAIWSVRQLALTICKIIQKQNLTFHVNEQQSTTNSVYNKYYSQKKMSEPLFTPRTDFIIQPKWTLFSYTQPRFRCANSKVSDPIKLAEHELWGLSCIHVRVLGSPRSDGHSNTSCERHSNIRSVWACGGLRRRDVKSWSLDVSLTFLPSTRSLGGWSNGNIISWLLNIKGRHLKRIHTGTSKTITESHIVNHTNRFAFEMFVLCYVRSVFTACGVYTWMTERLGRTEHPDAGRLAL